MSKKECFNYNIYYCYCTRINSGLKCVYDFYPNYIYDDDE